LCFTTSIHNRGGLIGSGFNHLKHAGTVEVVEGGDIPLACPEALFIVAEVFYTVITPRPSRGLAGVVFVLQINVPSPAAKYQHQRLLELGWRC